jgi:hypothetical protein
VFFLGRSAGAKHRLMALRRVHNGTSDLGPGQVTKLFKGSDKNEDVLFSCLLILTQNLWADQIYRDQAGFPTCYQKDNHVYFFEWDGIIQNAKYKAVFYFNLQRVTFKIHITKFQDVNSVKNTFKACAFRNYKTHRRLLQNEIA